MTASTQTLTLPYPHRASLELTWLPQRPLGDSEGRPMVFVHLVDQEGRLRRTFDHPFPEAWDPGSEVTYPLDLHQSAIAPSIAPGSYDLTMGLYTTSGRRWPLEVEAPELDEEKYALAEVVVPHPVTPSPRFRFTGAWEMPQETGVRQIVATRWLRGETAELVIWGNDRPGEVKLSFAIPRLQEQGFQLRANASDAAPAVTVASDCGGVEGGLSGYGSHEIRFLVPASKTTGRCTIRFDPSSYFIDSDGSRTLSALLETVTWAPVASPPEDGEKWTHRRRIIRSPERYSVSLPGAAMPETLFLSNVGDEIVVGPRVIVNGRKDWFSIDDITAEIVEPGASDRDKALAIWALLVANRYHDVPTAHPLEPHDPVRLLNVYGYGFCDDAANSFMMLAEQVGLRARVWHLGGHVVAEAFYDGGWHMFDVDGEVFYLDDDERIASVSQLSTSPGLIQRGPGPGLIDAHDLVELYTSGDDNWVAQHLDDRSRHVMTFDLRPGESMLRSRRNRGLHVPSRTPNEPALYGNGRLIFEPVLRDGLFRKGAVEVTNVRIEADGEDRLNLVFAPEGENLEARLVYSFASPYPFLGGRVRIRGELSAPGTVELALSAYGKEWSRVWTTSEVGEVDARVSLDELLARGGSRRPVYRYDLRMAFRAPAEGSRWRVETLRFESDFQLAPHALPSFGKGDNEVLYFDATEGDRDVELAFGPSPTVRAFPVD